MQLQCFQDLAVRLVYGRCVQRGEINSRGLFRIVPHCFADGRKRNVPASGDGRVQRAIVLFALWRGELSGFSCQRVDQFFRIK